MKLLTKNRAELLKLFLTNPEKAFYMQEIGRILEKKPGTFQRTLNNMVSEGILTSEYRANARFFKANKKYPIYKELKSIVFKTVGIQGSIREMLEEIGNIKFAFIYGSYAKGKENYLSDIDLVIIGSPNEDKLIEELDELEKKIRREISYKIYSFKELKNEIKEKEPFTLEILRDKKIVLIGSVNELRKISEG
ncbi:MAG: nucleotidyltransferase domain-containing protein [Candidatus Hydromicrobium sp.]|nr:nucleotidyltransferase domain-containing protein [Candidatus Hydromicrobium sp.]